MVVAGIFIPANVSNNSKIVLYTTVEKSTFNYLDELDNENSKKMEDRISGFEDILKDKPLEFENNAINEILHHSDDLWFHYGIWDFYDKVLARGETKLRNK